MGAVCVAAIENNESYCSAALPCTHALAQHHPQLIPLASDADPELLRIATTNDASLLVDALVHWKVVLALVLGSAGQTRCQRFVSTFGPLVEMVLHP